MSEIELTCFSPLDSLKIQDINGFRSTVLDFYHRYGRTFLWRRNFEPYIIFVSEIMLQQTQTNRVEVLLPEFLDKFPDFKTLARASDGQVIAAWQGLGYNRRARYLHEAARVIYTNFDNILPLDHEALVALPGIGHNTAASILCYAYNVATIFVETNIRTVLTYHFFPHYLNASPEQIEQKIPERDFQKLVRLTLPDSGFREWYWALMDYGVYLKKQFGNLSRFSSMYTRQKPFKGSKRQARGLILKIITAEGSLLPSDNRLKSSGSTFDYSKILAELVSEGLIAESGNTYALPDKYLQ
jgi:A/G-specific adenine glycosylase